MIKQTTPIRLKYDNHRCWYTAQYAGVSAQGASRVLAIANLKEQLRKRGVDASEIAEVYR